MILGTRGSQGQQKPQGSVVNFNKLPFDEVLRQCNLQHANRLASKLKWVYYWPADT